MYLLKQFNGLLYCVFFIQYEKRWRKEKNNNVIYYTFYWPPLKFKISKKEEICTTKSSCYDYNTHTRTHTHRKLCERNVCAYVDVYNELSKVLQTHVYIFPWHQKFKPEIIIIFDPITKNTTKETIIKLKQNKSNKNDFYAHARTPDVRICLNRNDRADEESISLTDWLLGTSKQIKQNTHKQPTNQPHGSSLQYNKLSATRIHIHTVQIKK